MHSRGGALVFVRFGVSEHFPVVAIFRGVRGWPKWKNPRLPDRYDDAKVFASAPGSFGAEGTDGDGAPSSLPFSVGQPDRVGAKSGFKCFPCVF